MRDILSTLQDYTHRPYEYEINSNTHYIYICSICWKTTSLSSSHGDANHNWDEYYDQTLDGGLSLALLYLRFILSKNGTSLPDAKITIFSINTGVVFRHTAPKAALCLSSPPCGHKIILPIFHAADIPLTLVATDAYRQIVYLYLQITTRPTTDYLLAKFGITPHLKSCSLSDIHFAITISPLQFSHSMINTIQLPISGDWPTPNDHNCHIATGFRVTLVEYFKENTNAGETLLRDVASFPRLNARYRAFPRLAPGPQEATCNKIRYRFTTPSKEMDLILTTRLLSIKTTILSAFTAVRLFGTRSTKSGAQTSPSLKCNRKCKLCELS